MHTESFSALPTFSPSNFFIKATKPKASSWYWLIFLCSLQWKPDNYSRWRSSWVSLSKENFHFSKCTAINSHFCRSKPFYSRCSVTLHLLLMYSLGKLLSTKPPIVIVRKSLTHSSFQLLVITMLKKGKSFAANSCNNVFVCHMRWKSDRQYLCTPSVTLDWSADEILFRNLLTPAGAASLKEKKHFLLLVLLCGGRPCLPLH